MAFEQSNDNEFNSTLKTYYIVIILIFILAIFYYSKYLFNSENFEIEKNNITENFEIEKNDIIENFGVSLSPVVIIGKYGIGPWGLQNNWPDKTADWIWFTGGAAQNADVNPYWFCYVYNNLSSSDFKVRVNVIADDAGKLILNGVAIGNQYTGGWGGNWPSFDVSLKSGINTFSFYTKNGGGPAGLVACVTDASNGNLLFHTDNTWMYASKEPAHDDIATAMVPQIFPAFDLIPYNGGPWGLSTSWPDQTARWIWFTEGAQNGTDNNLSYLGYTYFNPGSVINANLAVIIDNQGQFYLNGILFTNFSANTFSNKSFTSSKESTGQGSINPNAPGLFQGGWGGNFVTIPVKLNTGVNTIVFAAQNTGGPAGLIATCYNENKVYFNTNSSWCYSASPLLATQISWLYNYQINNYISVGNLSTPGLLTTSLNLNASSKQYLTLQPFMTGNNGLTFCCDFQCKTNSWSRIFDFGNGVPSNNTPNNNIFLAIYDGNITLGIRTNVSTEFQKQIYSNINDNVWRNLILTIDTNGLVNLYINGTGVYNDIFAYPPSIYRFSNFIGRSNWDRDPYFNGNIKNFYFFNSVISSTAIQTISSGIFYSNTSLYYYLPLNSNEINPCNNTSIFNMKFQVNPVFVIPNYKMDPKWSQGIVFPDSSAEWIWYTNYTYPNSAPINTSTPYSIFYVFNLAEATEATVYFIIDNIATFYLNDIPQSLKVRDSYSFDVKDYIASVRVNLNSGNNVFVFDCINTEGPAALKVSVINSNNKILFNSNYSWLSSPAHASVSQILCYNSNLKATSVYEAGQYGMGPWGNRSDSLTSSKWIWYTPNSHVDAEKNDQPVYIYTVYYNDSSFPINASLIFECDDVAVVLLNGKNIGNNGGNWEAVITIQITLIPGQNTLVFQAKNGGGPTGLAVVIISGSKVILSSDASWYYLKNSYIDTPYQYLNLGTPLIQLLLQNDTNNTYINGKYLITMNGQAKFTAIDGKQCIQFPNSMSNYISFPFPNNKQFTFCYWVYAIDNSYYTIASITNSGFNPSFQCDIGGNTIMIFISSPTQWTIAAKYTFNYVGKWTHIAYTYDQTTFVAQLYINGSFALNAQGRGAFAYNPTTCILGRSGDRGRAFNGYMYNYNYFSNILTSSQISQIYSSSN